MQQHETARTALYEFDNLWDFTRWIANTERKWNLRHSVTNTPDRSWDLGVGWEDALKLATVGWPEGVKQLHALASSVPNDVVVTKTYGVAGEQPDVPRYLAGDPFNMIHRGKSKVPKPTMTIAVNISASAFVTAQEFANYGAAIVALVDHLESRRVRVELIGVFSGSPIQNGDRFAMSWHIKHAEDALDLSAVAFSLGHPAMLRRLGFAFLERTNAAWQSGMYGTPRNEPQPADFINPVEGALMISGVATSQNRCGTMPEALKFAKWQINNAYRKAGFKNDVPELEEL